MATWKSSDYPGEEVTLPLMGKKTGEKLRIIREELDKMYPGEYTWSKVAEKCDAITYHGLRKLEKAESEPRKSTVRALAEFYNVPLDVIYDKNSRLKMNKTFFLGTKEDMQQYFDDYLKHFGKHHILDTRSNIFNQIVDIYDGIEPEFDERGHPSMDNICIEISMKIYQENTGAKVMDRVIQEKTSIAEEDIETLEQIIKQQTMILSKYFKKLRQAKG